MNTIAKLVLFFLVYSGAIEAAELPSDGVIEHAEIVAVKCPAGYNPGTLTILTSEKTRSGLYKKATIAIEINACIALETKVRNSIDCRGVAWADLYVRNALVVGTDRIMESNGLCGGN